MWPKTQEALAAALLDPDLPPPAGLAERRFAVYRNNVTAGLVDALAESFPVAAALVGTDFFAALACDFIRARPPASPVLHEYGDDFADFIAGFAPAADLPYLADVARLDRAWLRAYHAADADALPLSALAAVDTEALDGLRLRLHPGCALVRSSWPVVAIWQAHQGDDPAAGLAALPEGGETAFVLRRDLDVVVRAVPGPAADFIAAQLEGQTLGAALTRLGDAGDAEASRHLAGLFEMGAVVGLADATA